MVLLYLKSAEHSSRELSEAMLYMSSQLNTRTAVEFKVYFQGRLGSFANNIYLEETSLSCSLHAAKKTRPVFISKSLVLCTYKFITQLNNN